MRTETTINNTYDFAIGKDLKNLPELRQIGFATNRRLLETERISHDCLLAEDTFQTINSPVTAGRQRASGLRFADPRIQSLCHALILFRLLPVGFRSGDLRQHLAGLSGRSPDTITQAAVTYQLRRLRLHGMIERLPNSFRYRITNRGLRTALFFTRLAAVSKRDANLFQILIRQMTQDRDVDIVLGKALGVLGVPVEYQIRTY